MNRCQRVYDDMCLLQETPQETPKHQNTTVLTHSVPKKRKRSDFEEICQCKTYPSPVMKVA
jgi:hypothetical protein